MKRAVIIAIAAGTSATVLLASVPLGPYPWYVSRASGVAAFAALALSVTLGLLVSSRGGPRWLPKTLVFELHQFLSVLGLALLAVHAGALLFDSTVPFTPFEILVPFAASYERAWVGAGVMGAWLAAAITASSWLKPRIGHRGWRRLHYASFAAFALGLVHAIGAGTDTQQPAIYWGYVFSAAAVAALTVFRVAARRGGRQQRAGQNTAARPSPRMSAATATPPSSTTAT